MRRKLLKILITPLILTFIYLIFISYPYFGSKINRYDSLGFLSLVEEKSVSFDKTFSMDRNTDQSDNHLLKNEKITARIKASEDNFGILLFRFAKLSAKVADVVVFRIKKEGEEWHYENNYKADQFQADQYFTFGFPPFKNSKNNTYVFEIESLSGTYKNGIGISLKEPQSALVYKYSREDLKNYNILLFFVAKKIIYVVSSINSFQNWRFLATFVLPITLILLMLEKVIKISDLVRFFLYLKKNGKTILKMIPEIKITYLSLEKKAIKFSKKTNRRFTSTKFYLLCLDTNTKKKVAIFLLIFLLAFTYRYSSSLVNLTDLFYSTLGGQGDYDQLIRVSTCSLKLCFGIIIYNFLFLTPLLGAFYAIFGFIGGIKAFLYLMIFISSIVAALPYLILTFRKSWFSVGGIIGSLFLATNDFLTTISLGFPIDNSSLFTFSVFYITYLLTLHFRTIRWLLFLGLMGVFDGLNKVLFLINNLGALLLFVPLFYFRKTRRFKNLLFSNDNLKTLLKALVPLLVFLLVYILWEYITYTKFSFSRYFLWGLFFAKNDQVSYYATNNIILAKSLFSRFVFLSTSVIVMINRVISLSNFSMIFLASVFLSMMSLMRLEKQQIRKIIFFIFSIFLISILVLIRNNQNDIHVTFMGENIASRWNLDTYISIFLLIEIIALFILKFKYFVLAPIIFYAIVLSLFAKSAPFDRLYAHVVVWSVILLAYIIDSFILDFNKYLKTKIKIMFSGFALILFIYAYVFPKVMTTASQLNSGLTSRQNEVNYLKWVNSSLPDNAVVLAGGKSDLINVSDNLKKPIVYNSLVGAALLIRPNEIPGVLQGDFDIIKELKNKDNFKKNKYTILEDDIFVWRRRVTGIEDNIFSISPKSLHSDNYFIEVYKFNPNLKKGIYELKIKKNENPL